MPEEIGEPKFAGLPSTGKSHNQFTRRDFFKLTGTLGALLCCAAIPVVGEVTGARKAVVDSWKWMTATEEERLLKLGLQDYIPVMDKFKPLRETFQVAPSLGDIEGDLNRASRGHLDYIEDRIAGLKDAGSNKDNAIRDAQAYLNELVIDTQDTQEDSEKVRQRFSEIANIFPAGILALSPEKKIKILRGGGNAAWGYFGVASPLNPDNLPADIHELSHRLEDNWPKFIRYVGKEGIINYWSTLLEGVYDVAKDYLTLPWEQASTYKHGGVLIWPAPLSMDSILRMEKEIASYSSEPFNTDEIPEDKKADSSYRYNRLVHRYGKLLLGWADKPTLTEEEKKHKYNFYLADLKIALIGELGHYFVGPVQRKEGGLPRSVDEIADPSSFLVKTNLKIQKARLAAFSTLPEGADLDELYNSMMKV